MQPNATCQRKNAKRNSPSAGALSAFIGGQYAFCEANPIPETAQQMQPTQHVNEKTISVTARAPVPYRRSSAFIGGQYALCETNPIPETAPQMQPNATRQRKNENDARNRPERQRPAR
jgi:hypothetical protein